MDPSESLFPKWGGWLCLVRGREPEAMGRRLYGDEISGQDERLLSSSEGGSVAGKGVQMAGGDGGGWTMAGGTGPGGELAKKTGGRQNCLPPVRVLSRL